MLKKYLGITFGLVSLILIVIILINPPTDFDGGPMLAYNFLFFFPMLIGAGLLSIISIIISIRRFTKNKGLNIISIVLSSPGLIYLALISLVLIISTELETIERPEQIHSNSESIVLNGKTLHLTGFQFGKDYERRRVYISGIPYFNANFSKTDAYFCQGSSVFELFYSSDPDSLWIYIPQSEPLYHDINGKNLDRIPVRAIQLTNRQIDSLKNLESDKIKRFEWEEITEPNK